MLLMIVLKNALLLFQLSLGCSYQQFHLNNIISHLPTSSHSIGKANFPSNLHLSTDWKQDRIAATNVRGFSGTPIGNPSG